MHPILEELSTALLSPIEGQSSECLNARKAPAAGLAQDDTLAPWSCAMVLQHLEMAYRSSQQRVEERLQKGRPSARKANWKQLGIRTLMLNVGYFPPGRKAPEGVDPRLQEASLAGSGGQLRSADEIKATHREALAKLDECLNRGEQAFGPTTPLATHFALGPLTARQWRRFHLVHGRHHAQQIRGILGKAS